MSCSGLIGAAPENVLGFEIGIGGEAGAHDTKSVSYSLVAFHAPGFIIQA